MTAWSAKVSSRAIWLSVKGRPGWADRRCTPRRSLSREHWYGRGPVRRRADRTRAIGVLGVALASVDVDGAWFEGSPRQARPGGPGAPECDGAPPRGLREVKLCWAAKCTSSTVEPKQHRGRRALASPQGVLAIVSMTGSRSGVGTSSRSPAGSRSSLSVAPAPLARGSGSQFEQPEVLDGDDRLGGEGLQELDLPVGERPNLVRRMPIAPMARPAEQRNAQHCPETEGSRKATGAQGTRRPRPAHRGRGSSAGRVPNVPRSCHESGGTRPRDERGSAPRERPNGARHRRPGRLRHRGPRTVGRRSSTPPRTRAGRRSASWR